MLDTEDIVRAVQGGYRPAYLLPQSSAEAGICLTKRETRVALFLLIPRHHYQQNKQQLMK